MVLDQLDHADLYSALHPRFARAFETLRGSGIGALEPGRHDIDGDRLYLVIAQGEGLTPEKAVLEAHRAYIDIQFVIQGRDMIGWKPARDCSAITQPYDSAKDVELYGDRPVCWSPVGGGTFTVYFPGDAHAPMGGVGQLRRAIVKVKV
ncbi:MAG TPA: YhcH/YjgK/YiaL family protein [Bacteroidota bacterium]|nr:YhcH/YjgK/YiaL family protein [Bacteroidota bacterium]